MSGSLLTSIVFASLSDTRAGERQKPPLVKNANLEAAGRDPSTPAEFSLRGDAAWKFAGTSNEFSSMGVVLDSGRDHDGDGKREGSVAQDVSIDTSHPGRWFRFQVRGLPEDGFTVAGDDLHMKVDFFAEKGRRPLDGVTRKIYPLIEQERRDLSVNGVRHKGARPPGRPMRSSFASRFPRSTRSA